jgi:hypothetical protein
METYREQFERVGIEEAESPKDADLVIVNGEGSLHHGHHRELLEWPSRRPSVFVNAVYEANPTSPKMGEFLYRSARESMSADYMRDQGYECDVVPDVILTNRRLNAVKYNPAAVDGIGLTDNVVAGASGTSVRKSPAAYLDWLSQWEGVACGRFHAAIACAVIGIPFSTWDSNTWKIRGLMKDMGIPQFHADDNQLAAAAIVPNSLPSQVVEYVERGKKKIDRMFESFLDLV